MPAAPLQPRAELPWDTLRFVLAAGGVALLFLGVGWWLARRAMQAPAAPEPLYAGLQGLPTPKPLPAARMSSSPAPSLVGTFQVGASAVEVVTFSTQPQRRIIIAADQPIRVGKSPDVASRPELGVPVAAGNQAFDWGVVGRDERLFAVAAPGGSRATVTVMTRLPG